MLCHLDEITKQVARDQLIRITVVTYIVNMKLCKRKKPVLCIVHSLKQKSLTQYLNRLAENHLKDKRVGSSSNQDGWFLMIVLLSVLENSILL